MRFIKNLSAKDYKLYLISSRFGFLEMVTIRIIEKNKLKDIFQELHFNFNNRQPHIFKNELIKMLNLDKFVDDDLHLLKYVAGRNNKIKLYWLNNKLNKKISNNIRAITKLSDILIK